MTNGTKTWLILSMLGVGALAYVLANDEPRVFMPGPLTAGHHQYEQRCDICHGAAFGGGSEIQERCVTCHAQALYDARDSHGRRKFADPRNADRIARIDVTRCVGCHGEHRPQMTRESGVTVPRDFCSACHQDIATERASHKGMEFSTCAAAGCHKFHDNRSLYEAFLLKHADEADIAAEPRVPPRNFARVSRELEGQPLPTPLAPAQNDAPATIRANGTLLANWSASSHARAGVNCMDCHKAPQGDGWIARPAYTSCARCHAHENGGFLAGKHGMRLAARLPAMTPAQARLPMKSAARSHELGCASCHDAHGVNTQVAAVRACLRCHDDEHTKRYRDSIHYDLWKKELAGILPPGSGVSCATCHLPREVQRAQGRDLIRVQHNQSANLRPNEKMLRDVCLRCHGLRFALDALADPALVRANFDGQPNIHVESIDMARQRAQDIATRRKGDRHEPQS
jgi:hypothetical protein